MLKHEGLTDAEEEEEAADAINPPKCGVFLLVLASISSPTSVAVAVAAAKASSSSPSASEWLEPEVRERNTIPQNATHIHFW